MSRQALQFWLALLVWQAMRFTALTLFVTSDWQSWVMFYAVLEMFANVALLEWWYRRMGFHNTGDGLVIQLGARDPRGVAMIGMILYFCATSFCATVPLINDTSVILPEGPPIGPISVVTASEHPQARSFEFSDGVARLDYLGAVNYSFTPRIKQSFYAAPFVKADWTSDQPVAVWAIVSESELSTGDVKGRRFGHVVPHRSIHHEAFAKAVLNAEQRHALLTSPTAVLVRLMATPTSPAGHWQHPAFWMGLIYLTTWLMAGPYAARLFAPEPKPTTVEQSPAIVPIQTQTVESTSDSSAVVPQKFDADAPSKSSVRRPWRQRRSFWFVTHLGIFTALAIGLLNAPFGWLGFPMMFVAGIVEAWLLFRAFSNPRVRETSRFGCLIAALPISLALAVLLLGIGALGLVEGRSLKRAVTVDLTTDEIPQDATFLEFTGDRESRADLAGEFLAPTEHASTWWMIPVVARNWTPETPVRVWLHSTNRTKAKDLEEPLRHAVRVKAKHDFRITMALADAVNRHGINSAPDAIIVRRAVNLEQRFTDAAGMVALGALVCLLAWSFCACFWPPDRISAG